MTETPEQMNARLLSELEHIQKEMGKVDDLKAEIAKLKERNRKLGESEARAWKSRIELLDTMQNQRSAAMEAVRILRVKNEKLTALLKEIHGKCDCWSATDVRNKIAETIGNKDEQDY